MVKHQRKRWYDNQADWVPPKGRQFELKQPRHGASPQMNEAVPQKEKRIRTDAEGMENAYKQGDVWSQGDTMYVAGSHTARDWFDDVTKIPTWQNVPRGLNGFIDMMNSPLGKAFYGTGDLRQAERYQKAEAYLNAHPEIKQLQGDSLGGAVVIQLAKSHPERNLQTVTYNAPVWDPLGTQKRQDEMDGNLRFSNKGDLVSIFDNSAKKTYHPDPLSHIPSLLHDYHNEEQAGGRLNGNPVDIGDDGS